MEIEVEILRRDLFALNVYMLPRSRGIWTRMLLLAMVGWAFILFIKPPNAQLNLAWTTCVSILGGLFGVVFGFVIQMTQMLVTASEKDGVLGKHYLSLTDNGLREVTNTNQSLYCWNGIQRIIKVPHWIFFQVNNYQFQIVPRRAFADTQQFQAFFEASESLRNAAVLET
ncbi:MAG: YcxB family protein [Planctomyces sp.]|nr:YcxB family protein [Planctomyces sp.]